MALELLVERLLAGGSRGDGTQDTTQHTTHSRQGGERGLQKLLLPAAALGTVAWPCLLQHFGAHMSAPRAADYHKREQAAPFSASARHGMVRLLLLLAFDGTARSSRRPSGSGELGLAALRELTRASNRGTQAGLHRADAEASRHLFHPPSLRMLFDPKPRAARSGAHDLAERVAVPGTAAQQGAGVARARHDGAGAASGGGVDDDSGLVLPVGVPEHGDRYVRL